MMHVTINRQLLIGLGLTFSLSATSAFSDGWDPISQADPSFLRVNNGIAGNHAGTAGIVSHGPSALCLTCHTK